MTHGSDVILPESPGKGPRSVPPILSRRFHEAGGVVSQTATDTTHGSSSVWWRVSGPAERRHASPADARGLSDSMLLRRMPLSEVTDAVQRDPVQRTSPGPPDRPLFDCF